MYSIVKQGNNFRVAHEGALYAPFGRLSQLLDAHRAQISAACDRITYDVPERVSRSFPNIEPLSIEEQADFESSLRRLADRLSARVDAIRAFERHPKDIRYINVYSGEQESLDIPRFRDLAEKLSERRLVT